MKWNCKKICQNCLWLQIFLDHIDALENIIHQLKDQAQKISEQEKANKEQALQIESKSSDFICVCHL